MGVRGKWGMYTVARRPADIVQKTRRGRKSNENVDHPHAPDNLLAAESKKIVFRPVSMKNITYPILEEEHMSQEYWEMVNFVNTGWISVKTELEQDNDSVKYYQEKSNPMLANFSPFDLEDWWGKRLYQNLTNGL